MSGSGMIPAARTMPCEERIDAAVAAEQRACVDYLRGKIAEVERLAERRRVPAMEADMLKRRLDAVAEAITAGLHRE